MNQTGLLYTRNVQKYFYDPVKIHVLKNINMGLQQGEFVSIMGKSGCGKSTLLYVLSTMDTQYEGELYMDGEKLTGKSAGRLAQIRNEKIGFVFQFHYLLPEFTVLKNVCLPGYKLGRYSNAEVEERGMERLRWLGLEKHAQKAAYRLSGGEKQRVAIARALINDPLILMGDEPTGNLDKRNTEIVFDIFRSIAAERGQSLLVVTHDPEFAARTDRVIEMEDGNIIS
jgi:lipoprotein-releasing system ATP-binding protein